MKQNSPFDQRTVAFLKRFSGCERGAIAMIVAIAMIPLIIAGGLAVDLSRAYLVQSRLAHSLDAAGLAAGSKRTASAESAYLEAQFTSFFTANYPDTELGTTHDLTFVDNGGIITVTGKATVETAFMSIVGVNSITVSATAEIEVETNGLELVMVLDNSGSMGGWGTTKMDSMQAAALDLIDILFEDEDNPDLIKVGLVPFDNTVNIGTGNVTYVNDPDAYSWGSGNDWEGCVMARDYPYDVNDSDTATGGMWDPFWNAEKSSNRNYKCPRPITALTNSRATLETEINAMSALGATHINLGAIWGWRVLSSTAPFTEGAAYDDEDWNKAAIILTDGDNTFFNNSSTYYSAYEPDDITVSQLDARLLEACTGMKNSGITVYTIAFGSSISSSTQTLLESCATSADNYYESPDSDTLTTAFRAIGAELKQLHLSK